MKPSQLCYLFLALAFVVQSCKKDIIKLPQKPGRDTLALVQSVTWDIGSQHKMEFFYNTDGSIKKLTSGNSNLPWKYTYEFTYENKRLKSTLFDDQETTLYTYNSKGQIVKKSYINQGQETSRFIYTYNNNNKIEEYITMTLIHGKMQMIGDAYYTYTSDKLSQTQTDYYDENFVKTHTITHQFTSFSPEVNINPHALVNTLYQHQMPEIYDDVILINFKQLPENINETGNPQTGPVVYHYIITQTGKRIDKLKFSVKIGNAAPYFTNEAVFHY